MVDPMVPEEGLDWFDGRPLERVVLGNRHHYRQSDQFAERFGIPVFVVEQGLHEVEGRPGIQTYKFGEEVAPGIVSYNLLEGWPDEGELLVAHAGGALTITDGAIHYGPNIDFVPDEHLGDDPAAEKEKLSEGFRKLLDLDFDALLFTHGSPITEGGKAALREFAGG